MKKIYLLISVTAFLLFFLSCEKQTVSANCNDKNTIPLEEALSSLQSTLDLIEPSTKSTRKFSKSNIKILGSLDLKQTKSDVADSLYYVVNFDNNNGYAVLAADRRVHSPVLMIIDTGEFNLGNYLENEGFNNPNNFGISLLGSGGGIGGETLPDDDPDDGETPGGSGPTFPTTVYPLLVSKWGQGSPFNDNFHRPEGETERRPAGCTVIAAAQILANNKDVSLSQYFNVTTSTWTDLDKRDFNNISDPYYQVRRQDIAKVVKAMADGIGVQYNYLGSGGTFAQPLWVKNYLISIGYDDAVKHVGYNETTIKIMIANRKPVFIAALDGAYGHAWVIDGYINTGNQMLFHCNMGWNGASDGYYASGLFDTTSGPVQYDGADPRLDGPEMEFGWWYRIITY